MNSMQPLQLTVCFIISFSLTYGYPSSLFDGNAYSGTVHRHRNKNWCAFIVQKNVSCAVQGSVESYAEPEAARCPQHQPDCEQQVIANTFTSWTITQGSKYRTRFRPTYKIAYKLVTELEWRCCPGYQGPDCRELKGSPNRQPVHPQSHQPSHPGQPRHAQRPERRETGQYDVRRADKTRMLEEEVQRLSQTVLDLQSAMTGMAENLRTDLQEDTSKMLITLLNDRNPPDSARTGGTEESVVHLDGHQATRGHTHGEREIEKVLARLNDMTDALKSKDEELEELRGTLKGHDGQIRMLMDTSQGLPITDADILQTYIDGKFEKLKKELVADMEDQMTSLKKTCDDKIQSFQKACKEGKDGGYGSLSDLVHNKEAELRKEIRELRLDLSVSDGLVRTNRETTDVKENGDYNDLRREINRVAEAHRVLNARVDNELKHLSTLKIEDMFGTRIEDLEDRMNVTEKNAETYCFYVDEKLNTRITDEVAVLRQLLDEKLNAVQDQFTGMLIEINNNSFPGLFMDSLQTQVTSHTFLIQGLEDKFNAIGQICSAGCPTGSTPTDSQKTDDSLVKDVGLLRKNVDFLSSKIVNNAAKLHALEDTVTRMSPQKQFINAHIQDTHNRLNTLTDNVNGLTGAVTGLGDTVSKFSQDLHTLNSTCCRSGPDSIPALQVESGPSQTQIEELRDNLDKLSERVTTELSVCKLNTDGVAEGVSAVDHRVTALEKICGRLDGGTNHFQGLVGDLGRQVAKINATVGSHSGEITALQKSLLNFQSQLADVAKQILKDHTTREHGLPVRQERPVSVPDTRPPVQPNRPYIPHIHIPLVIPHRTVPVTGRPPHIPRQPYFPQPPSSPRQPTHPVQPNQLPAHQPVVVTGQAGPPGYVRRVTVRRDRTSEDTKTAVTGFAGAPGYHPVNPVSYNTKHTRSAAHVPWNPVHQRPIATPVSQQNSFMDPFSFSAGLTRQTFSGDFGIIRFDRVLVNDGGHYNPNTGIFTVPTDGRYLVTAVLTAPRGEHAEAALSVSNRSVQKLDTAGYWSGHPRQTRDQCMCGGSASFSLILPLRQGDTVALVRTAGKLAVSESREILSTFSAIFLYAPQARR